MKNKIKRLATELKEELEKECDLKPIIEIKFYNINQKINFHKANEIANKLLLQLEGDKRLGIGSDTIFVGNEYSNIADLTIFVSKHEELKRKGLKNGSNKKVIN
jgi:hypothetical protein